MSKNYDIVEKFLKIMIYIFILAFLIIEIIQYLYNGGFSKLRYNPKSNNATFYVEDLSENLDGIKLADEELQKQVIYMIDDVRDYVENEYNITLQKPKLELFVSNKFGYSFTQVSIKNSNVVQICLDETATLFAEQKNVIIHEIFHFLSYHDGHLTYVNDNKDKIVSTLSEGITDILTDKYIEARDLKLEKRRDVSNYWYYIRVADFVFYEFSEKDMAKYYFLGDTKVIEQFNERIIKNAGTINCFNAYNQLNTALYIIGNYEKNDIQKQKSFYYSLELLSYYAISTNDSIKQEYKEMVKGMLKKYKEYWNLQDNEEYIKAKKYIIDLF